jgi:prephenate dehydrogenase
MIEKIRPIEFAIIGAGRFGIFWGNHLAAHYSTSFYDSNPGVSKKSKAAGRWQTLEQCLRKDYIFLTIPIGQIPMFLKNHARQIKKGAVLIDCASVKLPVLAWFEKYISPDVYYIASHPLFGPDSARFGLQDHLLALMPGYVPLQHYNFLVRLFTREMHLNVLSMSADEHDRLMAYNLSLVHHLGRTLNELGVARLPLRMAGMKKLSEISQIVMNDSEELFRDFYRFNPYSVKLRDDFLAAFARQGGLNTINVRE